VKERDIARQKDVLESRRPKVLYVDIETSYAVGTFWGSRMWKTDILDVIQESMPIMVGYMWEGDKKARSFCLKDFKGYKPGLFNIDDKALAERTRDLLNEADVVVGQNSQSFDVRMLMARFWHHRIPAPDGFDQEDTKIRAKKTFYLASYKLKHMAKFAGVKQKTDPGGIRAWDDVIKHGTGWENMSKYCRNDVETTRELFLSMRGYVKSKVIANLFTRKPYHCPNVTCMARDYQKAGRRATKTGWKQKFVCMVCGTRWLGALEKDDSKLNITMA
jgi:DNA polymerase elongation subunit (family B)